MVLAVVDRDLDVDHRVAGDRAAGQHLAHALFHRRDELPRDDAALDRVDELEAGAARERLDAQEDLAELARAAGLLLVPMVALGRRRDGLAVGDARRRGVDLEAVPVLQPLEQHAQVQLAQAVDDRLVGGGHMLELQARVLVHQLAQQLPQALLVAVPLRADRQPVHRHREGERLEVDVRVLGGVVQHGVEGDVVDLGHRGQVARQRLVDLDVGLALQHEQVADLERLARVADVELAVLGDAPLPDAEDPHAPGVRVHRDLEDMRQHVHRRVGHGVHRLGSVALAVEEVRRIGLVRVGQQLDDDVEQLGHAGAALRAREDDRDQVALAQRLLQRRVQLGGVDVAVVQVAFDEVGVDLHHLLDQRTVGVGDGTEVAVAVAVVEAVDDGRGALVGQVDRQALAAEDGLDLRQ